MNQIIKNERNSSIELLRLIAIFGIVMSHCCTYGINKMIPLGIEQYSWQLLLSNIISQMGDVGNYVFILISGYFMISSTIRKKRIIYLILEIFFYQWTIPALVYITGLGTLYNIDMSGSVFYYIAPMWFGANWFVCCYVILCLFIPYLNKLAVTLSQTEYLKLLLTFYILGYILTFFKAVTYIEIGHNLITFMYIYMIGGYLRLYKNSLKTKKWEIFAFLSGNLMVLSVLLIAYIGHTIQSDTLLQNVKMFSPMLSVIFAVSLYECFERRKFNNLIINHMASSVLGIYLIHENRFMRTVLWNGLFDNTNLVQGKFFPLFLVGETTIVFSVCMVIDLIRKGICRVIMQSIKQRKKRRTTW